jgi:Flp pilus assembly protein TadD
VVYGRAVGHGFINYDDPRFLTDNAQVQSGLTWATVTWAFTNHVESYIMPLSWLSHALDCRLFGMWGGGHHLVSLILHALNAVLLFWVLRRLTGAMWPSALVAALFAVHPLHVESVVWASERKDVLSTLFWCLTLLAYAQYAAKPMVRRYLLVALLYALALMSKPMVITLPCLLLLLDYWPLNRIRFDMPGRYIVRTGARLALEKVPLFALAAADGVATFLLQGASNAPVTVDDRSMPLRVVNAVVTYVFFIVKSVVPTGLSVIYPWPVDGFPAWQLVGAVLLLSVITAVALMMAKKRPYLIVGWLWYLGLMAPVMQVMQRHTFSYARADRYTYCALIGLIIMVVWTARDVLAAADARTEKHAKDPDFGFASFVAAVLGLGALLSCGAVSFFQVGYWEDSVSLFQHALEVTPDNYPAHVSLGRALQNQNRFSEAEAHFRKALELRPKDDEVLNNLALAVQAQGRYGDAETVLKKALSLNPNDADTLANLGAVMKALGSFADAQTQLQRALEINPDHLLALTNLSAVLQAQGRLVEAETYAKKALAVAPEQTDAQFNLGSIFQAQSRYSEAEPLFRKVVERDPNNVSALSNLGAALLSMRRFDEAVVPLVKALKLKPDHVTALINMGMIRQAQGNCNEAKDHFLRALAFKPDSAAALNGLAWICATSPDESCRDGKKAVECAERVLAMAGVRATEPHAKVQDILAAAYARNGQFEKAVETESKALELLKAVPGLTETRLREVAGGYQHRLLLYGENAAYVDETAGL